MPVLDLTTVSNPAHAIVVSVRELGHSGTDPFDCHVGGQYLCTTPEPQPVAARILLDRGHPPSTILIFRRQNYEDRITTIAKALGIVTLRDLAAVSPERKDAA
jgi:hypothetical protein